MKSYLKFLSRNKLYTVIEAVGLAVSLAFVILIGSYVVQQYQVARENPDWARIYALGTDEFVGLGYWDKEEVEMAIPEVEAATRLSLTATSVIELGGEKYSGPMGYGLEVDPAFFDLFPYYQWREGTADAFRQKNAVVLSESLAQQLAVTTDATGDLIGKIIRIQEKEYVVTGVIQDFKNNIVPQVDALLNVESSYGADQEKGFNSIGNYATLCRVRADVDRAEFDAKIHDLIVKDYGPVWGEEKIKDWRTWRMDEIFWNNGDHNGRIKSGNKQMINLLTVVVLLLLLSAVFNYINLSFALGGKRAKEMATRRLLGEDRSGIIWKNIGESVAFTAVCFAVGLLLAYLLVPTINALLSTQDVTMPVDAEVKLNLFLTPGYVVVYILGILVLGALCGLIPAWAASRYEPIDVIKGTLRRKNRMVFSKVFIIIQNVLTVVMLTAAFVIALQLHHLIHAPLGFNTKNLFYIYSMDDAQALRSQLEAMPFVEEIGEFSGTSLANYNSNQTTINRDDKFVTFYTAEFDSTAWRLTGLTVLKEFEQAENGVYLTEEMMRQMGFTDKDRVLDYYNGTKDAIVGVLKDFHRINVLNDVQPFSIRLKQHIDNPNLLVKTNGTKESKAAFIKMLSDKGYEDKLLKWYVVSLEETVAESFEENQRLLHIISLFTLVAIVISIMGFVGMSLFFIRQRKKEIGLRKIMGSTSQEVMSLMLRTFLLPLFVSFIIAIPLAWNIMSDWLTNFSYRITLSPWMLLVPCRP